ncbi:MAG: hypothetical protein H6721_19955 [Sandaracinus sp.]|nr:hypothetical protein [Myxococcales bacterium]MCB9598914.1 hypothetical protein [Sandaracinus sp.]MCB9618279.1 hypothetical protein [Sandaracinus sp.]MCB9624153.1 hypothetical protein [Sandaracinus sp.]MCB9634405.1 hypothetical protein [Sandaracinus sp.]
MLVRCSRCGAPLDVAQGARRAKCGYCGATSRVASTQTLAAVTPGGWKAPPTWSPPPGLGLPSELPLQHARRAVRRASCTALFGTLFTAGMALIPLFASGTLSMPFFGKAARWDGSETLHCAVNETLEIEDLVIPEGAPTPLVLIEAAGPNCRVVLRNVQLRGDTIVRAGINAQVEIERSTLEGTTLVEGQTNTTVTLRDVRARARSHVVEAGLGATVDVRGDSKLSAGSTAIAVGLNGKVSLDGPVVVEAERDAIEGELNFELRSRDARIVSRSGAGVRAGMNARIRLEGGRVEGRPALRTSGRADVEQNGTEIADL